MDEFFDKLKDGAYKAKGGAERIAKEVAKRTSNAITYTKLTFAVNEAQNKVKDIYTENRRHNITGVRQQKLKDRPGQDLSYAYISAETTFDAMPDEIYVLLVNDNGEDVFAHESPFNTILVTGDTNINVLGRYISDEEIGDDCLLHYRKYIKDKNVQGTSCMFYVQREKAVFYHKNPYFNVESVSDDQEFLMRTSLPF